MRDELQCGGYRERSDKGSAKLLEIRDLIPHHWKRIRDSSGSVGAHIRKELQTWKRFSTRCIVRTQMGTVRVMHLSNIGAAGPPNKAIERKRNEKY